MRDKRITAGHPPSGAAPGPQRSPGAPRTPRRERRPRGSRTVRSAPPQRALAENLRLARGQQEEQLDHPPMVSGVIDPDELGL
jgi:hypothetical protein